jgi:hypothetical protein
MKKNLNILVALILTLSLALIAGCSSGGTSSSALSGKYTIVSMEQDGEEMLEMFRMIGVNPDGIYIEFSGENKFSMMMTFMGEEEATTGTYEVNGKNIILSADGDDIPGTIDGNKITMEQDGTKMIFEKK